MNNVFLTFLKKNNYFFEYYNQTIPKPLDRNRGQKLIKFIEENSKLIKKDTDNHIILKKILRFENYMENYDLTERIYTAVKNHFPANAFKNLECDEECWVKIILQDDLEAAKLILENSKQLEFDVNTALEKAMDYNNKAKKIRSYIMNNFVENLKLKPLSSFLDEYPGFLKNNSYEKIINHYVILIKNAYKKNSKENFEMQTTFFVRLLLQASAHSNHKYMETTISCISILPDELIEKISQTWSYYYFSAKDLITLYSGKPDNQFIKKIIKKIPKDHNNCYHNILKYIVTQYSSQLDTEDFSQILQKISLSNPDPIFFKEIIKKYPKKIDKNNLLNIVSEICEEWAWRNTASPTEKYEIVHYILKNHCTSEEIHTYLQTILKNRKYILFKKIIEDTNIIIKDQSINSLFITCIDNTHLIYPDKHSDLVALAFLKYRRNAIINSKLNNYKLSKLIGHGAFKLVEFVLNEKLNSNSPVSLLKPLFNALDSKFATKEDKMTILNLIVFIFSKYENQIKNNAQEIYNEIIHMMAG